MKAHASEYTFRLPEYPRTLHLPFSPNAARSDLIASNDDVKDIFLSDNVFVEEKVDGANCGMMLIDEEIPVIRNRNHVLTKGYSKATPAKSQFSSVWNWFYDHKSQFRALNETLGFQAGVYGEWLFALHGIKYDKLPSLFIAFDIYDYYNGYFIDTQKSRDALQKCGFSVVPLPHKGAVKSHEHIESFCQEQSIFASERREGIYVKVTDGTQVIKRFKMIRNDFVQGCNWSDKTITRNKLR